MDNPESTPTPPRPVEAVSNAKPANPARPPLNFWKRALRWTLVMGIVFGLGAVLILLTLFVPARNQVFRLEKELSSLQQKVDEASRQADQKVAAAETQQQQKMLDLQNKLSGLTSEQAKNKALQEQLDQSNLHLAILSARTDLLTARLALSKEDAAAARLALTRTPDTLQKIATLLASDQAKTIESMQDRLKLALKEMESEMQAASMDLDVLSTSLLQMENSLFAPR